jgi:hypothetical protein
MKNARRLVKLSQARGNQTKAKGETKENKREENESFFFPESGPFKGLRRFERQYFLPAPRSAESARVPSAAPVGGGPSGERRPEPNLAQLSVFRK